jgi:hypothetical protein
MIALQTVEVLAAVCMSILYALAVAGYGWLGLRLMVNPSDRVVIHSRVGRLGLLWLSFVFGQGILGSLWLGVAGAALLMPSVVFGVCAVGWLLFACQIVTISQELFRGSAPSPSILSILFHCGSWYSWIAVCITAVTLLWGFIVLLPPDNYDAAVWYLTSAKLIAVTHKIELQPFIMPHAALYPLQVETHWAALFTITTETAVTVWDYLCAFSFLSGIGFLAWSLTDSRRVALLAITMMFTSSGFYNLAGAGKTDIAAAQYGIAAFLWLTIRPVLGRAATVHAGLCAGWAMAARYTNFILLPALFVPIIVAAYRSLSVPTTRPPKPATRFVLSESLVLGFAASVVLMPMLLKNWLLVGSPLAPLLGDTQAFWFYSEDRQNITPLDLAFYPFVWTFKYLDDSFGNISPLFLGCLPLFLLYRADRLPRLTSLAAVGGVVSLLSWLAIKPLILYTRWLLIPLGLLTIPLSAGLVAADSDRSGSRGSRLLIRSSVAIACLFLLFESRAALYGARYLLSLDTRDAKYASVRGSGYDVIAWLNANVGAGERVVLSNWRAYKYLLNPDILLNSESSQELQWLSDNAERLSRPEQWRYYAQQSFSYMIVSREEGRFLPSLATPELGIRLVYAGTNDSVLKLEPK